MRWLAWMMLALPAGAQSVAPVIAEYQVKASGSFQVTNTTAAPMAVVLEPKSFSIELNGRGVFRALDRGIHLEMSASSMRLEPRETATVFYKAWADEAPAWLTIYASFVPVKLGPGLNVRIMLPHTIYLYQREPLERDGVLVGPVTYDAAAHRVVFELTNRSERAARAEQVEVKGEHASTQASGFPLLPHETRQLTLEWTSAHAPRVVEIEFPKFTLKLPVSEAGAMASARGEDPLVRR